MGRSISITLELGFSPTQGITSEDHGALMSHISWPARATVQGMGVAPAPVTLKASDARALRCRSAYCAARVLEHVMRPDVVGHRRSAFCNET